MNYKENLLDTIERVKKVHTTNLKHVEFLIKNIPLKAQPVILDHYQCEFGTWLYSEGKILSETLGKTFYNELEALHTLWHEEYSKIHQLYFDDRQGVFRKFLGKRHKELTRDEHDLAKTSFEDLQVTTKQLIQKMEALTRRVRAQSFD